MTVLIAGGGTGGHVFPMLAVGDAVRALEADAEVFYVGTKRGIEARVMPERGDDLELLDVAPLRGGGIGGFIKGALRAAGTLPAARRLVAKRKPDVVLSVGGYAGGPIALAARFMGVPLAILEPNGVLGLSNKLLVPIVDRAYTGFGDLDQRFKTGVAKSLGVPLRKAFERAPYVPSPSRFRLLVLGGSLGAIALNEAMPDAFARILEAVPHASIVHQTGRGRAEAVRAAYSTKGICNHVRVSDFIDDVASELSQADVVIQRSGASSLAELCAIGRASILVPFPFAADQHQLANARGLEGHGAAIALIQSEASSERIGSELLALASDTERRARMAEAAANLGRPHAARDIAADLLALSRSKKKARS